MYAVLEENIRNFRFSKSGTIYAYTLTHTKYKQTFRRLAIAS